MAHFVRFLPCHLCNSEALAPMFPWARGSNSLRITWYKVLKYGGKITSLAETRVHPVNQGQEILVHPSNHSLGSNGRKFLYTQVTIFLYQTAMNLGQLCYSYTVHGHSEMVKQ